MRISNLAAATTALLGCLLSAAPSLAHHSFAAEWDSRNCREFTGTLTKVDWQNPHPYFYVDVKDEKGKVENWSVQADSRVKLRGNGTDRQVCLDNDTKSHGVRGYVSRTREPIGEAGREPNIL